MKILVVQDHLRSGGTERQSVFLSKAFTEAEHETTLLTFRPGGRLAATVPGEVRHDVLQSVDLGLDWFAPGLKRCAKALAPDIVLCMGRMANCYGATLQRALPQAVVLATMRTGKPLPWLFQRSLQRVRHIVANSREARDTLVQRYGVDPKRVAVIYNSIVLPKPSQPGSAMASARTALRAQHGAGARTVVALCVAMFRPEKNQRELIETFAALPRTADCHLWLAGDGPARGECEALVRTHGLSDRVKFVGFHQDPSSLYAAADIAVHASASDALSNFVIEAQSHGLPAVVYSAQGMNECVVPERTGWVIGRGEHDAFRSQVLALVTESPETRLTRSEAARAYTRATFDPERQVAAYLELFTQLIGRAPEA